MSWFRPWTFAALAWSLAVAWMMVMPSTSVEAAVSGWPALLEIPSLDKLLHAGSFGLVAWLWARAMAESDREVQGPARWILPLLGTVLYGAFLEGVQSFLPSRAMQWTDILANSVGAACTVMLSRRTRLKQLV